MNTLRFRLSTTVVAFILGAAMAFCQAAPSSEGFGKLRNQLCLVSPSYFEKLPAGLEPSIGRPGLTFNQFNTASPSQDKTQSGAGLLFNTRPLSTQLLPLTSLFAQKGYICRAPVINQSPNALEPIPPQWAGLKIESLPTQWSNLHLSPVAIAPTTLTPMPNHPK